MNKLSAICSFYAGAPALSFDWCPSAWEDPLTGTRVVRLSPDDGKEYTTAYFRLRHFTPDGRTMIMAGTRPGSPSNLVALDLVSGQYHDLGDFISGSMGLSYACAPHAPFAHLIVRGEDHEEIERVDIATGERIRIRPTREFGQIYDPGCTADGRYILVPDSDSYPRGRPWPIPAGMTELQINQERKRRPGVNRYYRVELATGKTEELFALENASLGHPNPNPVYPHLFMFSREGQPRINGRPNRIVVVDLERGHFLETEFPYRHGSCSHEMWSVDGRTIWGHSGYLGYQNISNYPLTEAQLTGRTPGTCAQWRTFLVPIGSGDSAHVHIAPNQQFLVGDGKNFGWNTEHEAAGKAAEVREHAFDGVGAHSPGEVIWHFTVPSQSLVKLGSEPWERRDDLLAPVYRNPELCVRVRPVCRFRSRMRLINQTMRLESNAHVTPDNRWVIFTSCSEDRRHEIWAARVPDLQ